MHPAHCLNKALKSMHNLSMIFFMVKSEKNLCTQKIQQILVSRQRLILMLQWRNQNSTRATVVYFTQASTRLHRKPFSFWRQIASLSENTCEN